MEAKKYAEELIKDFLSTSNEYGEYCDLIQAKQCALIHVKYLIDSSICASDSLEDQCTSKNHAESFFYEVEEEIKKR